jgi:DNA topoisomerase-2
MQAAEAEGLEKRFKLTSVINTSNLVCFDPQGRICKYENVEILMREFYGLRLNYYMKRKEAMLSRLTFEWTKLDNKVRFIKEIIAGALKVQNRKKVDLLRELQRRNYFPVPKPKAAVVAGSDSAAGAGAGEDEEEGDDIPAGVPASSDYDYLLSMPIWSLTMEKVKLGRSCGNSFIVGGMCIYS